MLLGYIMVDEVYAPTIQRKQQGDLSPFELRWYYLGSGMCLVPIWFGTTVLGAWFGNQLSAEITEKLGFTLPLIFTSIIVPSLVPRPALYAALSAGLAGIILAPLDYKLGLIIAAGIGIMVGVLSEKRPNSQEASS
jgi:predicted branched-subunit amino acid permease